MARVNESPLIPQWPDYSRREIDFTALQNHRNRSLALHRAAAMNGWQSQVAPDDLVEEPSAYSQAPGGLPSSLYSHETYNPSSSRVPSMISTDTVASTSQSPSHGSVSSFNLEANQATANCPLITGQSKECVPEYCGINAPCLSFVNQFPEIEESDLTPCVHRSYQQRSPAEVKEPQIADSNNDTPMLDQEDVTARSRREKRTSISSRTASSGPKNDDATRSKGRQAHSLVERKYRENLNAKIEELHDALKRTRNRAMAGQPFTRSTQPFGSANRARKGDILTDALNYIYQSQVDMRHMAEEIARLKAQAIEQPPSKCEDCALRKQVKTLRLLAEAGD